jgi:hypothetical protein
MRKKPHNPKYTKQRLAKKKTRLARKKAEAAMTNPDMWKR